MPAAFGYIITLVIKAISMDHQEARNENGDGADKWQKREQHRRQYTPDSYAQKRAFRHASNTLGFVGFAGHILRTGGILAPLIIGEFVTDPDKKWKAIRLSAVATAVISEALYAYHHAQGKQGCRQDRDGDLENNLRTALAGGGFSQGM